PGDLEESRGRQIDRDDDRSGCDCGYYGTTELAQHPIAHVAQIGGAGAKIQVLRFVILAYLQVHGRAPCSLRGVTALDSRERRLGHDGISEHRYLKGEYRLGCSVSGTFHQRRQFGARGSDGGAHSARLFVGTATIAERQS